MKVLLSLTSLLAFQILVQAQTVTNQENWMEDALELLLENQEEESDRSDLELSLKEWIKHPINLNKVSYEDLDALFFLTPNQKQQIIRHREKFGHFISKYELQAVSGLDANSISLLNQFCKFDEQLVTSHATAAEKLKAGDHTIMLQHRREFTQPENIPKQYVGSQDYLSIRYRFQYKTNWYLGFSFEKDPGEKWGLVGDFQTIHLFYKGSKLLKTLALGDFHANFGTGLSMGSSHFSGKSSLVFQTQILQNGISPSRSLSEMGFLRGIGISLGKKNKQLAIWLSGSPVSASIFTDSILQVNYLSGVLLSGLHRTPQELAKKNAAIQQNYGFHFTLLKPTWQLGFILQKKEIINHASLTSLNNIHNLLNLQINTYASTFGSKQIKNINLQYELALQNWKEKAFIIKAIIPIHSKLDGLILYRNYDAKYTNSAANGWSSLGILGNEMGLYWAFIFKPTRKHSISLFADTYNTKSATFQKFKPAMGSDFFISYQQSFTKTFQLEARYRYINSEKNKSSQFEDPMIQLISLDKHQIRFQINDQFHESWKYQFRIEWVKAQNNTGKWANGSFIYYDINYQPKNSQWRFRTRYCLYQVEDYAARLYMSESDLPLNFANKMLHKNGFYCYFLSSLKLNKLTDIYIKYAYNYVPAFELKDQNWAEFYSLSKSIVKCMIRFKF